ncbi:hypothetical protein [Kitasatospora viridis]|uniref:Uncharacterized protein n=1 Tax=Kitasatospora viridis TaxID=281105 RepID=A0A561UDD0_9ACTN|nr:hypothetical protein [Kitasatospora viridis]TWF97369.1 hypothetical protein FHX73_111149 [Kitasatospora viridis]
MSKMTIRTYRITATGKRVPLTRKRRVWVDPETYVLPITGEWPACRCPLHRRPTA